MMYYYKNSNGKQFFCLKEERTDLIPITKEEYDNCMPAAPDIMNRPVSRQKLEARKEMSEIRTWLNAHDYMINKHILGEYADDDARWIAYLNERRIKLARYNELETQLKEK